MKGLPLAGIKVIDLGMFVAGPYSAIVLSDLGADVIKIEPFTGDPNRSIYRAYACCNRGKRSIALDFKTPEGLAIAKRLCVRADVVMHNFRPGVCERLGLDGDALRRENPNLVFVESTAYGSTGPKAHLPGFDMIMQAYCGHEQRGAGTGNVPLWHRFAAVDFAGGNLAAIAALGALLRRSREKRGRTVYSNLLNAGIYLSSELRHDADGGSRGIETLNTQQTGAHPAQSLYQTSDGWIAIFARTPQLARNLAICLDIPELAHTQVASWGEQERDAIATRIKEATSSDLLSALQAHGVWAAPCRKDQWRTLFTDAGMESLGAVFRDQDPAYGSVTQIGRGAHYSAAEPDTKMTRGVVAAVGQHTREVLAEIGYDAAEIDGFYEKRAVA